MTDLFHLTGRRAVLYCYIAIWFSLSVCENRRFNQTLSNSIEVNRNRSISVLRLYSYLFVSHNLCKLAIPNHNFYPCPSVIPSTFYLTFSLVYTHGYKMVDYYRHRQWEIFARNFFTGFKPFIPLPYVKPKSFCKG